MNSNIVDEQSILRQVLANPEQATSRDIPIRNRKTPFPSLPIEHRMRIEYPRSKPMHKENSIHQRDTSTVERSPFLNFRRKEDRKTETKKVFGKTGRNVLPIFHPSKNSRGMPPTNACNVHRGRRDKKRDQEKHRHRLSSIARGRRPSREARGQRPSREARGRRPSRKERDGAPHS